MSTARPRESSRALGAAMLAGGILAGISVALPPAASRSETAVAVLGAVAIALGALLVRVRRAPKEWVLGAGLALGTGLITIATWAGGPDTGTGANEILYIWVCIYAFYFLALPHALGQLTLVAMAYAWLLGERGTPLEVAINEWMITLVTLLLAGLLIARLRTSLRRVMTELSQRARHDWLTGVLNRQEFEERGNLELARQRRHGSQLALIALDVDDFKGLNDSLGHPAGDEVLREIGRMLDSETRRIDAVARVGGDEFAVLLPSTDERSAQLIAQRLLVAARSYEDSGGAAYTVSLGVGVAGPEPTSLFALWATADEALYAAKRAGGDHVAIARVSESRAPDKVAGH